MVWSECSSGASVAMKVESFDRETTRVATFTLPNSVGRQFGICSVKSRSCWGDGFHTVDFGATGRVRGGVRRSVIELTSRAWISKIIAAANGAPLAMRKYVFYSRIGV